MKPSSLYFLLVGRTALAVCAVVSSASAQPMPPRPPAGPVAAPSPPPGGAAYTAQQLAETRGVMQRFTLTPRGDLDGFLLADGTQVHVPPHLTTELAAALRPGDPVAVRGYRSSSVPLIIAAAVTELTTNQTVVDQGPPPPGSRPPPPPPGVPAPGAWQASLGGKVQTPLYGPRGDVNGALLEDGTIIRLPPPVAAQSPSLLMPGRNITAQGFTLGTAYGRVIDAQCVEPAAPLVTPAAPGGAAALAYPAGPGLPPQPLGQ